VARKLVWVEIERFHGWACSSCEWEFKSSGPLIGNTLEEMKRNYERRRDEEFNAHVCAEQKKLSLAPKLGILCKSPNSDRDCLSRLSK
jgi:hypothetical protein